MNIQTINGTEALEDYTEDITIIDFLAVHPLILASGGLHSSHWTITHIPTGHRIFQSFYDFGTACNIASGIVESVPELKNVMLAEDVTLEMRNGCYAVKDDIEKF